MVTFLKNEKITVTHLPSMQAVGHLEQPSQEDPLLPKMGYQQNI